MGDALEVYLHDHLAGSQFAIELLDSLRERYCGESLGSFAQTFAEKVREDQDTLKEIIAQVGKTHFDLTEAAGWIAEKASQLKLRRDHQDGGIGTFEALETLSLGIKGKLALWKVLQVIRTVDARIPQLDFEVLEARATEQFETVEQRRLQQSLTTFGSPRKQN